CAVLEGRDPLPEAGAGRGGRRAAAPARRHRTALPGRRRTAAGGAARGERVVKCRAAWAGAVLSAVLLLTGCGGGLSADGEALTLDQSEALAQVRFRLAAQGDGVIELTAGDADAVDHVAGTLTLDFDDGVAWGELARGPEGIAVTEQVAFTPDLYLVRTAGGWQRTTAPSPMLR